MPFNVLIVLVVLCVGLFIPIIAGLMLNSRKPTPANDTNEDSDREQRTEDYITRQQN